MKQLKLLLQATRARTLPVMIAPVLLGSVLAWEQGSPFRWELFALALLGSLGWSGGHASGLLAPVEHNRLLSQIENQPMLFFVAKGPAGSCGPGCDEWIAAEGNFVPDTPQRFRNFLAILSQKNLPIFFHSRGGRALAAITKRRARRAAPRFADR